MNVPDENEKLLGQVVLDRYRIVRLLGTGGMGAVFEAQHVNLPKKYAVKAMQPPVYATREMREQMVERFNREAKLCASVKHPNLVEVTDFGTSEGGLYIVMEYVQGRDLASLLKQRDMFDERECLRIIRAASAAVGALHAKGILHRDLKPANIMIEDKTRRIVLADLGIAKDLHGEHGLTENILGTPAYMAPEQMGNASQVTKASDIYGLGATLYAMLSGHAPFRGETAYDVIAKAVEARQDFHSLADVAQRRDRLALPPEIASLLDGMTAFDPAKRIQMIEEVERRICVLLESKPANEAHEDREAAQEKRPDQLVIAPGDPASAPTPATAPLSARSDARQKVLAALSDPEEEIDDDQTRSSPAKLIVAATAIAIIVAAAALLGLPDTLAKEDSNAKPSPSRAPANAAGAARKRGSQVETPGPVSASSPPLSIDEIPAALSILLPGADDLELVRVPPGKFRIGSEDGDKDERPSREVEITQPYYIGRYEVTVAQFAAYLNEAQVSDVTDAEAMMLEYADPQWRPLPDCRGKPIVSITHSQARAFCRWLSKRTDLDVRLPGEVEWEYAARGPAAPAYPWGDEWSPNRCHSIDQPSLADVGSYVSGRSWCGAEDMAGNVFEWCADRYSARRYRTLPPKDPPIKGVGSSDGLRVIRGGCFGNSDPMVYRAAFRQGAEGRVGELGFRVMVRATQAVLKYAEQPKETRAGGN